MGGWTAYKLCVKDIVEKDFLDGFIKYGNSEVSRVRVMGTVVSKFTGENYGFFIIDDGTETIRVRGFENVLKLIKSVKIGEIVDVIGRIKKYEDEIYVTPEIIKKIKDPNWTILRKIELKVQEKSLPKTEGVKKNQTVEGKENVVEEMVVDRVVQETPNGQTELGATLENPRQKVIKVIKENDSGEGVELPKLMELSGLEENVVDNVLTDLMNEGEIFEPRAGKIKMLE